VDARPNTWAQTAGGDRRARAVASPGDGTPAGGAWAGANEALRVTETINPRLQQLVDQPGEFDSRLRALPGYDRIEPYRAQILVVGSVDNVLRPRLVGQDTKMHELLIFFSTLGGLMFFGAMGFILGPILAALFVTAWEMFGTAFRAALAEPGSAAADSDYRRPV
jgi:AI-2E family transporter